MAEVKPENRSLPQSLAGVAATLGTDFGTLEIENFEMSTPDASKRSHSADGDKRSPELMAKRAEAAKRFRKEAKIAGKKAAEAEMAGKTASEAAGASKNVPDQAGCPACVLAGYNGISAWPAEASRK